MFAPQIPLKFYSKEGFPCQLNDSDVSVLDSKIKVKRKEVNKKKKKSTVKMQNRTQLLEKKRALGRTVQENSCKRKPLTLSY